MISGLWLVSPSGVRRCALIYDGVWMVQTEYPDGTGMVVELNCELAEMFFLGTHAQ